MLAAPGPGRPGLEAPSVHGEGGLGPACMSGFMRSSLWLRGAPEASPGSGVRHSPPLQGECHGRAQGLVPLTLTRRTSLRLRQDLT